MSINTLLSNPYILEELKQAIAPPSPASLTFNAPLTEVSNDVYLSLSEYLAVDATGLTLAIPVAGENGQILSNNLTGVNPVLTWIDAGQSIYTIPTKPVITWVSTSAEFNITTGSGLELTSFKSGDGVFTAGGLSELTATLSVATAVGVSVNFVGTGWFPAINPFCFGTPVMVNAWCYNAIGSITTPCRATGELAGDGSLTLSILTTPVALAIGDIITLDYSQFSYISAT